MNEKQWMQHDFGAFTWKLHKAPLNIHFLKKKILLALLCHFKMCQIMYALKKELLYSE